MCLNFPAESSLISSVDWFVLVYFQPYEHEIFLIGSLRNSAVWLVDMEALCCICCEVIITIQLFHALQGAILRTEHGKNRNIRFSTYFSRILVKIVPK